MPPGPCTKIRNEWPLLALPKLKNASIRFALTTTNGIALMRAPVARSIANTEVTFDTPLIVKQAPVINTSCGTAQCPLDGATENTTGARVPKANAQVTVRVNGPKMLLSPAVNVVVIVIVPVPPQQAAGKPVFELMPNDAEIGIVAVIRLQLTGVTFVNATTVSGMPSPLVSQAKVAAVVTVLPGRCSGTPVELWKPWQTVVTSFGKKPQPRMFNGTAHRASTRSVPPFGVNAPGVASTVVQSGFDGGAQPMPKNDTLPRFKSRCRVEVQAAASLPSKRRSKSGVAKVISPPAPMCAGLPSLNNSKMVGSVPSPIRQLQLIAAVWLPTRTPKVVSAPRAASERLVSHKPGGLSGSRPPMEKPVMTGKSGVPSRSMRQNSKMKLPLPSRRGGQPTGEAPATLGTTEKRKSVGPSCRSKGTELLPIGLAGSSFWLAFSSMPVPSSYSVTAKVLLALPGDTVVPVQSSSPKRGTLIQRTLKALTLAKPNACTGNAARLTSRDEGFKSAHAGAIPGGPV